MSFESSNSYVLISTGYNSDESLYERYIKNDGSNEFNVSLVGECFITISSIEEELLDVDNIDISYSCSKSQQEYFDPRLKFTYLKASNSFEVEKKSGFGSTDSNKVCLIPSYFIDDEHGKCPVSRIASYGFNACYFTTVHLPCSISSIESGGFNQCWYLDNIYVPDSVTTINAYGFSKCTRLTNIRLSERVTTFGMDVFDGCSSLESIHLPDSLTTMGSSTFVNCQKLKDVNCPKGLSKLSGSTFYYCHALVSFVIGANITTFSDSVFRNCDNIEDVTFLDTMEKFNKATKYKSWHSACPLLTQVTCTDGVVTFEAK